MKIIQDQSNLMLKKAAEKIPDTPADAKKGVETIKQIINIGTINT